MDNDYLVTIYCKHDDETVMYIIHSASPIDALKYECGSDIMELIAEWSKNENSTFVLEDEFWVDEKGNRCGLVTRSSVINIQPVSSIERRTM